MIFKKLLVFSLLEGKIDDVNEKHYDIPDTEKQNILTHVPHQNAQHYDWALRQHSSSPIDVNDLKETLTSFNTHKDKLKKKNIHQYKSLDELKTVVGEFKEKPKDHTVVYDSPTMSITQHHTHESAIEGAKLPKDNPYHEELNGKATWCTSADSSTGKQRFDQYTKDGRVPLYTIHDKKNNRKYALAADHTDDLEKTELRDEHDNFPFSTPASTDSGPHVKRFIEHYPEIMKTPLKDFMSGEQHKIHSDIKHNILSGTYTDSDVDTIFKDPQHTASRYMHVSMNPQDVKKHHIDSFFKNFNHDGYESNTRDKLIEHPDLDSSHIDTVLKSKSATPYTKEVMIRKSTAVSPRNIDTALDIEHFGLQHAAITHKNATEENYNKVIENPNRIKNQYGEYVHMAQYIPVDRMTPNNIHKIITDPGLPSEVRTNALRSVNASNENLKTAVKSNNVQLAVQALLHPNVSNEVIEIGKNHKSPAIQAVAKTVGEKKGA